MKKNSQIKENIIHFAKQVGFDTLGFASAQPLINESKQLRQWLEMKYNAEMNFFHKNLDKRQNVAEILPEAKTVIILAVNYYNRGNFHNGIDTKAEGKIARYAFGKDYHIILLDMLSKLVEKIKDLYPYAKCITYVDTGPVMEKRWAEKAGIGWQGKNSLIINKEFGSWIFLATLITNLDLEPDNPAVNHCGTCAICIEQCPTKAIVEPKIIDARKCISYWTIEDKTGEIPDNVLKNLNGWVFGCDICQQVCPWNEHSKQTKNTEFRKILHTKLLFCDILQITEEQFENIYQESPIGRRKLILLKKLIEKLKY